MKEITLLFGQSNVTCLKLRHLKHFLAKKDLGMVVLPTFSANWVDFSSCGTSLGALVGVLLLLDLKADPSLYCVMVP